MHDLLIRGASRVLAPASHADEWLNADIALSGATIRQVGRAGAAMSPHVFDADGLLALPGIVDIHGDAFERQIQPRPETVFDHAIALADTDRQLVANGITTACHGLTLSWEGGLRGREAALALLEELRRGAGRFQADHRVHLRFENHHVDGLRDVLDWIGEGRIHFLAFNDHLPGIARKTECPERIAAYAERARCDAPTFRDRLASAQRRSAEVPDVVRTLAAACLCHGIPMASHDEETRAGRDAYHALAVNVSEFPRTAEALEAAIDLGSQVVMGAPNVLLGGSHCGGLDAAVAIAHGRCHILASDYYYPSLLHAAFRLAYGLSACSLAQAWRLVSENPAAALSLHDRGRIEPGRRADLLLVRADAGKPTLVAAIAAGKLVYCAEPARLSIHSGLTLAA